MRKLIERYTAFTTTFNQNFSLPGIILLSLRKEGGPGGRIRDDRANLWFWLLLALSGLVSIILSPFKTTAVACFFIPFAFIGLYLLGRYRINEPEAFLRTMIRGAALLSLLAIVGRLLHLHWQIGSFRIFYAFGKGERGEILYIANNLLGLMAQAGLVGAAAWLMVKWRDQKYRLENIGCCLACLGGILVAGSRGAMMGSAVGILFILIQYGVLLVAIGLGSLTGVIYLLARIRGYSLFRFFQDPARMKIWQGTMRLIKDRLFFGWGPGVFQPVFERYRPAGLTMRVTCAHSNYLNIMAGWGIFGSVLLWGWQFFVIIRAWLRGLTPLQRIIIAILLSFYAHIAINDLFASYAGLLLGLVDNAACAARKKDEAAAEIAAGNPAGGA